MLIDTHCHLDFPEYDIDRSDCINRAQQGGVGCIINIGSSIEGSRRSVALAGEYPSVYATVGIHPHEADMFTPAAEKIIRDLAGKGKVVGIGEIGLDYYRNYSQAQSQRTLFASLLGVAKDCALPVVIHSRDAADDTIAMLKSAMPLAGVVHCFSQDEKFLRECLDLGLYISYTCNITYKKAERLRELVKMTPLERLMLETDAPYLSPEGLRGRRNEPLHVALLAREVARLKGTDEADIELITTRNAKELFRLTTL